jgi:hypothetical protein
MNFQIIASFEQLDQDIFDIVLTKDFYENEEKFVRIILNCIDETSIKELVKISVCQYTKTSLQWLRDSNGKYFFNIDVNKDMKTKKWYNFKNNYLENKKQQV